MDGMRGCIKKSSQGGSGVIYYSCIVCGEILVVWAWSGVKKASLANKFVSNQIKSMEHQLDLQVLILFLLTLHPAG